jgi:hypothetical protein
MMITCNRIHESRKFYTEILGFDVAMDMDWVVTLTSPSNPTAQITLVQETGSIKRQAVRGGANRRFKFHKRGQLFLRMHNETLSVAAMRVNNPDRSPVGIHA